MKLEKMILLSEAAERLGLPESKLRERIRNGELKAAVLSDERIVIAERIIIREELSLKASEGIIDINTELQSISKKNYEFLKNNQLTISEAADKYEISPWTLREWIRQDYIKITRYDRPFEINEMDVAYCAAIFKKQKAAGCARGAPLLDKNGLPYILKYPLLSAYRKVTKHSEFTPIES